MRFNSWSLREVYRTLELPGELSEESSGDVR